MIFLLHSLVYIFLFYEEEKSMKRDSGFEYIWDCEIFTYQKLLLLVVSNENSLCTRLTM